MIPTTAAIQATLDRATTGADARALFQATVPDGLSITQARAYLANCYAMLGIRAPWDKGGE